MIGVTAPQLGPDSMAAGQAMAAFLLDNASIVFAFCDPLPELRFWMAGVLDALKKDRDFRGE